MNLKLHGHTITLGPKALAFIETNMRGMGEVYCRDQLSLWLTGGKVDADVTIEGPARFVAKGNAIGIPAMPKAGAGGIAGPVDLPTSSGKSVPVASAAPADLYEPVGTMPQRGDRVVCLINPEDSYTWVNRLHEEGARFASEDGTFEVRDGEFNRYDDRGWRILKRQAPDAGLQVWRGPTTEWVYIVHGGKVWFKEADGVWVMCSWKWSHKKSRGCDRLVGPEAGKAIADAKKQGVL